MGRPQTPELERFMNKVKKTRSCWLWIAGKFNTGYGCFWVYATKESIGAHCWSYEYFVGEIPVGKAVLHKCDVRACINPKHLYLGTDLENQQDKWRRGRGVRCAGKRNGMFGKRPWNKGKRWSKVIRAKISAKAIGRVPWNKGIHIRPGWPPHAK